MGELSQDRRSPDGRSGSPESSRASWQTSRHSQKKHLAYSSRLSLAFAGIAATTVLLLVIILAIVWEGEFQKYTRSNMQRLAQTTAETLAEEYEREGGWTEEVLDYATTVLAASADAGIQVLDQDDRVIYDDTWAMAAAPQTQATASSDAGAQAGEGGDAQGSDAHATMVSLAPTASDSVVTAPITTSDGWRVGTVRVWALGSDVLLTKADAAFRTNSYGAIWTAAVISVIAASFVGARFARSIAKPVNRVTATAAQIRSGDLTARTGIVGEDEVGRLGETFDAMAERVEKDARLERRLTSDVAHELRTPLMAMLATVEAMQDGVLPADGEHLGIVRDEVKRLSRLVDAMLQLSRLENGTTPFEPQDTELVSLVSGVVSAQEQLFADKDLRLRFEDGTGRKECYAYVDRDMVRQAVTNFLSNALRYTPEGGWVLVKVSQNRDDALISVQDTGVGIAPEDLSRVFSRFWRSEASRAQEKGGLGVGLAVSKEIADRHGGHISVESELDKGTTFTLHLPRTRNPQERSSATMERGTSEEEERQ